MAQTGGTGLIVGPGCVLAMNTPDENVAAVVRALGGPLKPIPGIKARPETGHIPPPSGQGEETPDRAYAARCWM